jgi:hypothetical protein
MGWRGGVRALVGVDRVRGICVSWLQQRQGIDPDPAGDAFKALEAQVALAALDCAHIGSVEAQDVGKRLLAQSARFPVEP